MKKIAITCFFIILLFSLNAQDEYSKIKIKQKYKKTITGDLFLMDGNIGFYKIDGEEYLISVGVTEINGSNPNAILNARTVAEVIAHKQMVDLIYGVKINSKTVIERRTKKTKTMQKIRGIASVDTIKEIKKNINNIIIQESSGTLQGTEVAGYWRNISNTTMFMAVVYKFNKGDK